MPSEDLVTILEQIRDQQKQQLVNYEKAMESQTTAIELQKRWRKLMVFLVGAPWVLVVVLLFIMLFGSGLCRYGK